MRQAPASPAQGAVRHKDENEPLKDAREMHGAAFLPPAPDNVQRLEPL